MIFVRPWLLQACECYLYFLPWNKNGRKEKLKMKTNRSKLTQMYFKWIRYPNRNDYLKYVYSICSFRKWANILMFWVGASDLTLEEKISNIERDKERKLLASLNWRCCYGLISKICMCMNMQVYELDSLEK